MFAFVFVCVCVCVLSLSLSLSLCMGVCVCVCLCLCWCMYCHVLRLDLSMCLLSCVSALLVAPMCPLSPSVFQAKQQLDTFVRDVAYDTGMYGLAAAQTISMMLLALMGIYPSTVAATILMPIACSALPLLSPNVTKTCLVKWTFISLILISLVFGIMVFVTKYLRHTFSLEFDCKGTMEEALETSTTLKVPFFHYLCPLDPSPGCIKCVRGRAGGVAGWLGGRAVSGATQWKGDQRQMILCVPPLCYHGPV